MDNTILYAMMITVAMLMAMFPFAVLMGLGTLINIASSDPRMWISFMVLSVVMIFLLCLGSFALIQRTSCGKVKNLRQVASNSLLAAAIQGFIMTLITVVPWFRRIVSNIMPSDIDRNISDSVVYSYYSFWGALFGVAVGGAFSGSCSTD
jgi:hypothetical protein